MTPPQLLDAMDADGVAEVDTGPGKYRTLVIRTGDPQRPYVTVRWVPPRIVWATHCTGSQTVRTRPAGLRGGHWSDTPSEHPTLDEAWASATFHGRAGESAVLSSCTAVDPEETPQQLPK